MDLDGSCYPWRCRASQTLWGQLRSCVTRRNSGTNFKSFSKFWHHFWYPYVYAYIEAEAEKCVRIAKVLESWKQLLYPVAMTTHWGKYLGARLRLFFFFFLGPRGVPEWVDNSFIATWREDFPTWSSIQWQINAPRMVTDVTVAGFIFFRDKGLWWLLCYEK